MSILITGGTTGLGYYCSLSLARQFPKHHIIIASRTDTKDAAGSINRRLGQSNVSHMHLDLASLSQVRAFVQQWSTTEYPPIRHLLLNAGLQLPGPVEYSEDGYEKQLAVSLIGHALLFSLLLPHLAHTTRIVITGSGTHDPAQNWPVPAARYTTAEELAHPTTEMSKHPGNQRYSSSRLASLMWMYALERRLKKLRDTNQKNWTVASFCPGMMPGTNLIRASGRIEVFVWYHILPRCLPLLRWILGTSNVNTAETSGERLAWLTSGVKVADISGEYFEEKKQVQSSEASHDEAKQEELWEWTVRNIATSPDEIAQFSLKNLSV
ncbi:NAD(P)-binding protein [Aspergillus cavernicola]|uniref:NAD(P)-binding protein n=1 Tax=Aspergillus cavernicola TaxID=176166 RepID=A0ABR4HBC6_9EURO